MHFLNGERKHSVTAVPLIGRVVLIHEGIDNWDELAAATAAVATATTTAAAAAVLVVVVATVLRKEEE